MLTTTTLTIEAKQVGRRAVLAPTWHLDLQLKDSTLPLHDLLRQIVLEEVERFKQRQHDAKFIRVLTEGEINEAAETGKVDMGGQNWTQEVEPEEAVHVALQAFEDGLYYVFVDGEQIEQLGQAIALKPQTSVLFLRLVALAGG